jgi:hypothetical protein
MRRLAFIISIVTIATLGACGGDDDGGGGGSLQSRCEDWCARRNDDADCGPAANCPATCSAFVANAENTSCTTQFDALLDCFAASDDICTSGGSLVCGEENTELVLCENNAVSDGGT